MNFTKDDLLKYDKNIGADLVFVSGDAAIRVPEKCGLPREDQLQGTPLEQLCELAGRSCYGGMTGHGRSTPDYHAHLLESKHWSVYEHAWFPMSITLFGVDAMEFACELLPLVADLRGIKVRPFGFHGWFHVNFNVRHYLDLCTKNKFIRNETAQFIARQMRVQAIDEFFPVVSNFTEISASDKPPKYRADLENHASLYLSCSRNASHEQVRHRFAVSQRSTRFCDESQAPFVLHPNDSTYMPKFAETQADCRGAYSAAVKQCELSLSGHGLPATTARKQARGAARSYLPSNLATELMFTASVREWAHMLRMRMTNDADAEIRVLYNHILLALSEHATTAHIANVETVKADDGAGFVIAPGETLWDELADG